MSPETEKTPMTHFDDQEGPARAELFQFIVVAVVAGPFALLVGWGDRDLGVFIWGVGTSLLYLSVAGLVATVDFGVDEYATAVGARLSDVQPYLEAVIQSPATWVFLFFVGAAIVAGGTLRVMKWEDVHGGD